MVEGLEAYASPHMCLIVQVNADGAVTAILLQGSSRSGGLVPALSTAVLAPTAATAAAPPATATLVVVAMVAAAATTVLLIQARAHSFGHILTKKRGISRTFGLKKYGMYKNLRVRYSTDHCFETTKSKPFAACANMARHSGFNKVNTLLKYNTYINH
jgi:hypothetical protein